MSAIADLLARHNHPIYGMFTGPSVSGVRVRCNCGWEGKLNFEEMNDGDYDSSPYIDRLYAAHQESVILSGILGVHR